MTRSTLIRDLVVVTAIALVARVAAAAIMWWPPYTDPAYYQLVATRLAVGEGFTVPVIWSFLEVGSQIPADPQLPIPSNGHWMPLTSIVAAAGMALFGQTATWAGQVPIVVLGTALIPGTYLIGWWLFGSRRVGFIGALLMVFAGPLLLMVSTIDNFAVFGLAGAAAIAAAIRAVQVPKPLGWLAVSAVFVALATLARIDGVLLGLATFTAWLQVGPRIRPTRATARHLAAGALVAAIFVLVLSPWLLRNAATFGSLLPSTGGHSLWISTYNEQFSIGHEVSPATYWASGLGNIIGSKLVAFAELGARTLSLMGGVFALLLVTGSWSMRRRRDLRPFLVYFWVTVLVMALVFTFHAPKGAFYHSSMAWLPLALPLSVAAIPPFGRAAASLWPFLGRPPTHRFLGVVGLVGAIFLSLTGSALLYAEWAVSRDRDILAAGFLRDRAAASDVVMTTDPPSIHYFSGNPAVAVPFDPFPVIEKVVTAYDVRWVIVMRPGPGEPDPLGMWEGATSRDSEGNSPAFLPDEPAFETPNLRIFEVVSPDG